MPGFSPSAAPPPFRVVPQADQIRDDFLNDVRMKTPDGTWMRGRGSMLIPQHDATAMIVNTGSRTFSYRFDEAMRDNQVAARAMRRDAFLRGLMEERILPTINRRWQLEVDNDRDPQQRMVRDALTSLVEQIPDFDAFKRAQLDATWFGRAGCQWAYARDREVGGLWGVNRWNPIHGDSVQFTFEGTPAILLNSGVVGWYVQNGATTGSHGDIRPTDRGGTALVLQRPYWRDRFSIHVHMREQADYFEGELAGSVQGLGIRGLIYWHYVVRQDALSWMLAYMQAVGQMDLLVFNYPAGNYAAQQQQVKNANQIIGKAAIICPRNPQGNWAAVEQISMNEGGLRALQQLVADYFDRHIERIIVGQSMSSGADKGDGLGGTGRADFARACVPVEGSEILTRSGFKTPQDVVVGEEVLAYDAESDTCKWTPLLKKSFYKDCDVSTIDFGEGLTAVCTPDHSWAVEDIDYSRSLKKAHDLKPHHGVILVAPLSDESEVPELRADWPASRVVTAFPITMTDAGRADVWCPTTKYGTWVMRQNGRVMITGNTKDEIIVYDTGRLDFTLTRDLITPLKRYNFPWANFPVRFKSTMPDLDKQAKVQAGALLIQAGVPIKVDEWREAAGFTKPEPGDDVIGGQQPMMPGMTPPGGAPPAGPPQAPPPGLPGQGPPGPPAAAAGGPPVRSSAQAAGWGPHGGPNKIFGYRPQPVRNSEGGGPPAAGPVMGYPGGGNTYIPRFRKPDGTIDFTRYDAVDPSGHLLLPPART